MLYHVHVSRLDRNTREEEAVIVGLLAEKGGTGKTTLATKPRRGMGAAAGTLLVDADRQGSSRFWAQTRSSTMQQGTRRRPG